MDRQGTKKNIAEGRLEPLYELALLGAPTPTMAEGLEVELRRVVSGFSLRLGAEVSWAVGPDTFQPSQRRASAAVFAGAEGVSDRGLAKLLESGIPIIPIYPTPDKFSTEIPRLLRGFNGMHYATAGAQRVATALLECAGLMPHQRRVFVSYRRDESREAALQLFDELSARLFDVFLDTHGIPPGEDFQAMLWHRLCDSDMMIMLDTPTYFERRWTKAEFGRALAKKIRVLRIGWPGTPRSSRTATADAIDLVPTDVDPFTGRFTSIALEKICKQIEASRSESIAVRHLNLVGLMRVGMAEIGGSIDGVGPQKSIYLRLPDDRMLVACPTIGSPTSQTLHDAMVLSPGAAPAIVFDHVGLHSRHMDHLTWLSKNIPGVGLIKACEFAWRLADWE